MCGYCRFRVIINTDTPFRPVRVMRIEPLPCLFMKGSNEKLNTFLVHVLWYWTNAGSYSIKPMCYSTNPSHDISNKAEFSLCLILFTLPCGLKEE